MHRFVCIGLCSFLLAAFVMCQSEFGVGVGTEQQTTFGQKLDEEAVKV